MSELIREISGKKMELNGGDVDENDPDSLLDGYF